MLTEAQIQRYARHILLPEVGGVGQEKLLQADARLAGESLAAELAGDYLSAAGVQVDAHSGPGLRLELGGGGAVSVRVEEAALEVVASPCRACAGEACGPLPLEGGTVAACLAASELLRLVLGFDPGGRRWRVRGAQVERLSMPACPHGSAT